MPRLFEKRTRIPAPASKVFEWHLRPGAFERLNPPWEPVTVVKRTGEISNGGQVTLRIPLVGPFTKTWVSRHQGFIPGEQFQDVQLRGPFASLVHSHRVEADGPDACFLIDHLEYELPFGPLGSFGHHFVQRKLQRVFDYRHRLIAADIAAQAATTSGVSSMRILVSGSTGLVGSALVPLLTTSGHTVVRLTRGSKPKDPSTIHWDPENGQIDPKDFEGFDAVIHLAGENIAGLRWSASQKIRIRDSRVVATNLLTKTLATLQHKPKTLLCASAIGFYGNRGDELCTEQSVPGHDFLAKVCRDWELATQPASDARIRVVNLRIGIVLSPAGGALSKMRTPFNMGLGGVLGSGKQYMSCIAIDDVAGAIQHCLAHEELRGPVNVVCPDPVTNYEFTKTLGSVLHRPTIFPVPSLFLRILVGEMADALLLSSTRVTPDLLINSGYRFRCPTVESSLTHVLGLA